MRAAIGFLSFVVIATACSEPRVAEDRAAACSNKIDDDADGLIDCDDPDCAATEACERTETTCSNSIDDDRNGTLDCRQESCKALPICKDAVQSLCLLRPNPELSGCPLGKGCYVTPDGLRWCALEGAALAGQPCGVGDPSDRSQGCAAGHLCTARNRCARLCANDYDCTRNSICRQQTAGVKLCTASCVPGEGCGAGAECLAFQRIGLTIAQGGWAHECTATTNIPAGSIGTAGVGAACADDVTGRPTTEICNAGLLCIPEIGGARCREVCRAPIDGSFSSCNGGRCFAVVPFSGQPARFDELYAIGVCLP